MKHVVLTLLLFIMAQTAQAQDNYLVRVGDMLRVEVLEDPSLNRNALILPDGRFSFPFAGTIRAAGRTLDQIDEAITNGIASNFATAPTVFVSILSLSRDMPEAPAAAVAPAPPPTIDIYFIGEVGSPGPKTLAPGTTFLQALSAGGGLSKFAAQKRVQIRRTDPRTGQQKVYTVDYRKLANGAALQQDIVLQDGDVILVPERRLFE